MKQKPKISNPCMPLFACDMVFLVIEKIMKENFEKIMKYIFCWLGVTTTFTFGINMPRVSHHTCPASDYSQVLSPSENWSELDVLLS